MTGQRSFRLFLTSRGVSWAGSAMTLVALPVLLYQRTGSAALTGLLAGLEALPYLLLGLPAGALVDRWDHRRTMVFTSCLSGAAMASVPLAVWAGLLTTAHLLLAAALIASIFVFFDAASFGAVPAIVGRDGVAGATGAMVSVSTLINLAGPAAGGIGAATLGPATVLAFDAASYLLGALLLSRVRWDPVSPAGSPPPGGGRLTRTRSDIAEGLRYIWDHPVIRTLTLLGAVHSVAGGAVTGLLVVVAVDQYGLADDDPRIGFLYVAAAGGTLAASLLLRRAQQRLPTGTITLGALTVSWLALTGWSWNTSWPLGLGIILLWSAAGSLVILNGIVVRQTLTAPRLQARVNTTARMIAWGGTPLGAILGGSLAGRHGVRVALLTASTVAGLTLLGGLTARLRHVGRLDELVAAQENVSAGSEETTTAGQTAAPKETSRTEQAARPE